MAKSLANYGKKAWRLASRNYPVAMLSLKLNNLNPKDLNDHIRHHMAFTRNPVMKVWADKLEVRKWASERFSDLSFPELLWVGKEVSQINFDALPEQFAMKVNHASGATILVTNRADANSPMRNVFRGQTAQFLPIVVHPSQFDAELARRTLEGWLVRDFSYRNRQLPEWCYRGIERFAFVEQFLENGGQPAADIKILTANGQVVYCSHHSQRYFRHEQNIFDTKWQPMAIQATETYRSDPLPPKPQQLERILEIALEVAKHSKIVRVDFYEVEGHLYLGEITNYPMLGKLAYEPQSWIREFADRHLNA